MGKIVIKDISSIEVAAAEFLTLTKGVSLYAFYGSMGAGKTTFISALCRVQGVKDDVASPTFTIVNEYRASDGRSVFHFDFYRIESAREVLDIGYEEYVDSPDSICYMEWPEKVEELLPEETLKVTISVLPNGDREVVF